MYQSLCIINCELLAVYHALCLSLCIIVYYSLFGSAIGSVWFSHFVQLSVFHCICFTLHHMEILQQKLVHFQLMSLKRIKNELDRKLQEQEEELDEQAGTIQQLEQVRMCVRQ